MRLERKDGEFSIDAALLGELLDLPASRVQALMRGKEISGLCERGEEDHEGQYRLTITIVGKGWGLPTFLRRARPLMD